MSKTATTGPGRESGETLGEPGWSLTRLAYNYTTPFIRQVFLAGEF